MLVRIAAIALLMAMTIASAARDQPDAVSVTSRYIWRVDEIRDDGRHPSASSTAVLELHGAILKKSAACANISVEKAIDAAGADLANMDETAFDWNVRAQRIRLRSLPGDEPVAWIDVNLGPLSKGARKLARLKGRLQLMVLSDESRSVSIPYLKSRLNRTTPVPQLAADLIKLHVFETSERVTVYPDGNTSIIKSMEIDDANGKTISKGAFDQGKLPPFKCDFAVPREVDDQMSLKIQYAASYRIVSVPFDLKEFPGS